MEFFPAIDLMDGHCVRLYQGLKDKRTNYSAAPADTARTFADEGASGIHVVDLDGAFSGAGKNLATIREITRAVAIPVEVGGGIRNMADIEALFDLGVARIIIGTAAIVNPTLVQQAVLAHGAEKVLVGIDAHKGNVAIKGWAEKTSVMAEELALSIKRLGITSIVYTDILRDGTMTGPNIAETKTMAEKTALNIIASGGISSLIDIKNIITLEPHGVTGFIAGKAIYDNAFTVRDVMALLKGA
ncbi:MAG: 1-(5-phosphoribosyl)-5-[(5-phosphoribosylamino)methylideneamino]imidazole-4-carboxamide isomerase [Candidatus Raymondbacteria bacterium RifOxyC12_full_50_8]|uniref:1-(5-phosphoribosyl)-5-[(5-phosphoribosylamino)methylideneamino] imidazole-4-carboxamide isomerase n=1 Tax=Candidatus Raymondbacteria bacterium RIFOXYD12_FULL_49_13 TaxID=1817890 RepID=A0A1F7FC12_UNCRA|nr:MAG: 1-(5-phosphoribosyl)-5-[(5-phosphoribosylamino)methylideneamino]imidazole-4-carboxamide isomerase [Candidatus Raymondbacteria bacterium RIFOXYA2_FULL_49_16]OGJ96596.1 MAG: 1-(5-phosphoribosyl)-5-[(5-phosphoribosylamino)methylideneamino]imidazole-4-carboxamide isomerase [Candidatus Raymondbacteria bacterium RifOxyC12_full_50_8]OGK04220.1 MAG: 1-(5-phosphoribosyl)-5-[(5-phosphoribosylamino)methylideneamino]imidazole-4-carboxamide isomerase [Candidatus Raymondbacteria bacterium RIFOXYD12_FUL